MSLKKDASSSQFDNNPQCPEPLGSQGRSHPHLELGAEERAVSETSARDLGNASTEYSNSSSTEEVSLGFRSSSRHTRSLSRALLSLSESSHDSPELLLLHSLLSLSHTQLVPPWSPTDPQCHHQVDIFSTCRTDDSPISLYLCLLAC